MADIQSYSMLINGDWVAASNGGTVDSVNPATGDVWAQFPAATADDADLAVRAAADAGSTGPWATMTPTQRGHCLRRLGDLLAAQSEHLGQTECKDTGKLFSETRWQAKYIAEYFHFYAGCADKISGETLPIDKPDLFVYTQREPLGVIAAIVPWNSQLFLSAVKIGPALAAGNTMVMKASEHASAAMLEFAKLFDQAGIPAGVINIVTGHGEPCGSALTSHPLVARVSFTGGPQTARHIIKNSSENFAEVSLELGGKSPFIVFDDANLESAVNGSIAGIFGASGQSCVAGSRLYLQHNIADEFLARIVEQAKAIRLGDPMDSATEMGPLCTRAQVTNVENEIAFAIEEGGKVLCGGGQPDSPSGYYFEPTVIECPRQSLRIVDSELFAPVLSVVRFDSEQDVIEMANDSKHGLAAGIFTSNSARSLRMVKAINAGIVWVNTYRVISPVAEFGGMKNSGYGRESGFQAMYDYTRPKTVWMNLSDEPLANPFQPR